MRIRGLETLVFGKFCVRPKWMTPCHTYRQILYEHFICLLQLFEVFHTIALLHTVFYVRLKQVLELNQENSLHYGKQR